MKAKEFKVGRTFVGPLQHDADLLKDILDFAAGADMRVAVFSALGAVKKVTLAFYDQSAKQYQNVEFRQPMELVACWGNISTLEGRPHIHAHGVFADEEGHTVAGHIQAGTIIFAGEIRLQELLGESLHRQPDAVTGLSLWKV